MIRKISLLMFIVGCTATATLAHDFWIELDAYKVARDGVVTAQVKVGERFRGNVKARAADHIERFQLMHSDGVTEFVGESGAESSTARPGHAGTNVVAYRSKTRTIELPVKKFERYLEHEGLEFIIRERARLGESDKPGREIYSRCAKSIVQVGDTSDAGHALIVGHPLEIIPLRNPTGKQSDDPITFRVLYEGKPLSNAQVVLTPHEQPDARVIGRTGVRGEVKFRLPTGGLCLVTTIHMKRVADNPDVDWESLWASLTFEVGKD